jgi:putative flippase GtrA
VTADLLGYVAVAVLGAAVQVGVLAVLAAAGVPELPAFWAAWLVAWVHNWIWLTSVVFKDRRGRASKGLLAALLGLGVQTVAFAAFTGHLPVALAGAGAIALALPVTFLATHQWAFTRRHPVP